MKYLGYSAAGAALLPHLRPTVAFAQAAPPFSGPIDIYVRLYLSGGADGLTWVVPSDPSLHASLRAARPLLMGALDPANPNFTGLTDSPNKTLNIGRAWGLHPCWGSARVPAMVQNNLPGMYELISQGKAKILSKIGFPGLPPVSGASAGYEHDLNHVTATDPWNVGKTSVDRGSDLFWEVRLMQQAQLQWNQFWALGEGGRSVPPRPYPNGPAPIVTRHLSEVKRYQMSDWDGHRNGQLAFGASSEVEAAQQAIRSIAALPDEPNTAPSKKEYKRSMLAALANADSIQSNVASINLPGYMPDLDSNYPYGISETFRDIARIISYYYVNPANRRKLFIFAGLPNFDTHFEQVGRLLPYTQAINHCIGALTRYLTESGAFSRTVIQFVSEFGRGVSTRFVPASGSPYFIDGTPHGWGSMHFIVGGALDSSSGPVVGQLPTASDITNPIIVGSADRPDTTLLQATLDPRDVYYRIVQGMGFDAASIFTGFSPSPIDVI